jgi:hypothetical protein
MFRTANPFRGPILGASLAMLILLAAAPATGSAQSDHELRQENQRLATQVRDLQAELAAARAQMTEMQKQIDQLRVQLADTIDSLKAAARQPAPAPTPLPGAPPAKPEVVTIDESIPNASPRALLNALSESYREALGGLPIGDDITRDGRKNRSLYLQRVEQWAAAASRHFRAQIEWTVMVTTAPPLPAGTIVEVQAVDPQTRVRLGRPFRLDIARHQMERLRLLEDLGKLDLLLLRGIVEPRIVISRDLEYAGPFDAGRYIGPFAEFGFSINIKSVTGVREPEPPAPTPTKPAEGQSTSK